MLYAGHSARGSDAAYAEQRLDLYPEIRVNKAIRWRGIYSLQDSLNGNRFATDEIGFGRPSVGDPQHHAGWAFVDSRSMAGKTAFVTGAWRDSWITAQLPWGILAFGRRPSQFGTGWSTIGQTDIHARTLALVVPYGPVKIIIPHALHDSGEDADPWGARSPFQSTMDQNEVRDWNSVYAITYRTGNLDVGTLNRIVHYNDVSLRAVSGGPYDPVLGTDSLRSDPGLSFAASYLGDEHAYIPGVAVVGDVTSLSQVTYLKYNNGRLFLNAEFDFQYIEAARKGGRPIGGRLYAWHVEGGLYRGPIKLSLAHFLKTGHDRRGGTYDQSDRVDAAVGSQGAIQVYDKWESFNTFAGADQPIDPYQFLIGYYGGGNNAYSTTGYWVGSDLSAFAARVDYAIAANLNIFATFFKAFRQSETGTPRASMPAVPIWRAHSARTARPTSPTRTPTWGTRWTAA